MASSYIQWVRTQACCACGHPGPSHAHHHTDGRTSLDRPRSKNALGGKRGRGQKADDSETLPLCIKCHRQLHDFMGPIFGSMDGLARRIWQTDQVRIHHERHEAETSAVAAGTAPEDVTRAALRRKGFDPADFAARFCAEYGHSDQVRLHLARDLKRELREGGVPP